MKTFGVLCSGGDGPGMNAVIRAFVRTMYTLNQRVIGIKRGFQGILQEDFTIELTPSSVGNILQWGGTFLHTSRFPEFHQKSVRTQAVENLKKHAIDGLFVIGGDGSFNGGYLLANEHQYPVVCVPASIDNDILGCDYSIGFDTALHTAMEAIDKIRDTASSHERVFLVEVMGKHSPDLAVHVGVCSGAESVILDVKNPNLEKVVATVHRGIKRGKSYSIIIVSEGAKPGMAYEIQTQLKAQYELESHVCVLGHIQRGGVPTPRDRYVGAQYGFHAAKLFVDKTLEWVGKNPSAIVLQKDNIVAVPLSTSLEKKKRVELTTINMLETLGI